MDIFSAKTIHLTGIKGVAMTSLAQCLINMQKTITGSDVEEDFVTYDLLNQQPITLFPFFTKDSVPPALQTVRPDLLIYTAAHGGPIHPEVLWAKEQNIPVLSQAEAMAQLFNSKSGIAVCGVGGKSTVSAMLVWILTKMNQNPSFSVGVGNIIGLNKTGRWVNDSRYFVAEADEYVIDPQQQPPVPRFSFLQPDVIVCTNLQFDHPDVYQDFAMTKKAFLQFFLQLKAGGMLIINGDDQELVQLAEHVEQQRSDVKVYCFGESESVTMSLSHVHFEHGMSHAQLTLDNQQYPLRLPLPGKFNVLNSTAAVLAAHKIGIGAAQAVEALGTFQSTQRRFQFIGQKQEVLYYDDYAHHPHEVTAVIKAITQWYPDRRCVIAFQPHTYSRTKALREQFADAFTGAKEVLFLDIFASAREEFTDEISSDHLVADIHTKHPDIQVQNLHTIENLAEYCKTQLHPGDVLITLGAGDIYKVHDLIK